MKLQYLCVCSRTAGFRWICVHAQMCLGKLGCLTAPAHVAACVFLFVWYVPVDVFPCVI